MILFRDKYHLPREYDMTNGHDNRAEFCFCFRFACLLGVTSRVIAVARQEVNESKVF